MFRRLVIADVVARIARMKRILIGMTEKAVQRDGDEPFTRKAFGQAGPQVPVHGQGTWEIERGDRAEAIAALRRGFELGLTHVDTAEMYGAGEAERITGEALAGWREQVFVVSKVLPQRSMVTISSTVGVYLNQTSDWIWKSPSTSQSSGGPSVEATTPMARAPLRYP